MFLTPLEVSGGLGIVASGLVFTAAMLVLALDPAAGESDLDVLDAALTCALDIR